MSNERFVFRVWDDVEKRYIFPAFGMNVLKYIYDESGRYHLEQWTGMLDCEGKEVYEGDIVDATGKKGKVVWNNMLACYELIDVDAQTVSCENIKRDILVLENVNERNNTLSKETERLRKELENIKAELKMFQDKYNGSESRGSFERG